MLRFQASRSGYFDRGYYDWPPPSLGEVRARWLGWLWLLALGIGSVVLVAYVIGHDDPYQAGLSDQSWLTLGLAALLVGLLSIHRAAGMLPLLRALAEYSVVTLLVVLLATGPFQPTAKHPAGHAGGHATARAATGGQAAADGCPAVRQVPAWLACLWRQANPPPTKPKKGHALPPAPSRRSR